MKSNVLEYICFTVKSFMELVKYVLPSLELKYFIAISCAIENFLVSNTKEDVHMRTPMLASLLKILKLCGLLTLPAEKLEEIAEVLKVASMEQKIVLLLRNIPAKEKRNHRN